MDQLYYYIDQNFADQPFWVEMNELKPIQSVRADMENKTNGAVTKYTIWFTP